MRRVLLGIFFAAVTLTGCLSKSPGEQCLESFKTELKDPDSGKVISFNDSILVYTATNSFGARIQGRAICKSTDGKWSRSRYDEELTILKHTAEKLKAFNDCKSSGKSTEECAGESILLKIGSSDVESLKRESAIALGF